MIEVTAEVLLGAGALVIGWLGRGFVAAKRSGDTRHSTDRKVDAELEQHWTKTTLELVDTLRDELVEAKKELSNLRPMEARLAHLEEALDHIHNLVASETEAERQIAERRAKAFLRKMRGDDAKGEERNETQRAISKTRIIKDVEGGTA